MNVRELFQIIEKTDPEVYERISPRRKIFKSFASKVSLVALPLALGSLFQKAYGKTTTKLADSLNLALKFEYIQRALYTVALDYPDLFPGPGYEQAVRNMLRDEDGHVNFLRNLLQSVGETPIDMPAIDLTGGNGTGTGPFQHLFTDFTEFLNLAQSLEDAGVRAYKGQMTTVMVHNDFLQNFLRIHSVEARHAAKVRMMRRAHGDSVVVEPWIRADNSHIDDVFFESYYSGEAQTTQMGFSIIGINGAHVSANAASEAFDEPLAADRVEKLMDPFIAG